MATAKKSEAYNLSIFDEDISSYAYAGAPKRKSEHKTEKAHTGSKILQIPEEEIIRIRRRKHNPVKLIAGGFGGALAAFVVSAIIVGQVQLSELNQQVIAAEETLAEVQSIYSQNELKLESELSQSDIEEYAENVLGMTKAKNTQKEFVTLEGGDKAEVTSQNEENLFTRFIDSLKNLWS